MSIQTVELEIPEKLIPVLDTKARYIGLVGGRGSAKSESTSRITTMKAESEGSDLLCGREYQNSIDDSVRSTSHLVERLGIRVSPGTPRL
jgi:phage terminase large subunit